MCVHVFLYALYVCVYIYIYICVCVNMSREIARKELYRAYCSKDVSE